MYAMHQVLRVERVGGDRRHLLHAGVGRDRPVDTHGFEQGWDPESVSQQALGQQDALLAGLDPGTVQAPRSFRRGPVGCRLA